MVAVLEEADLVHHRTECYKRAYQVCPSQETFGRTRAGRLQPRRERPRKRVPSELQALHQRSDPGGIPPEGLTRPETVDEAVPQEAQGHAGARLHRPSY